MEMRQHLPLRVVEGYHNDRTHRRLLCVGAVYSIAHKLRGVKAVKEW